MLIERTFASDKLTLNFACGPAAGPALVLLHGVTRSWQDFLPLMPALAVRWQVHGLDFRGHGRSGRAPGQYRVVHYVDDVVALLRGQIQQPAIVYGHSLGAMVAAAVAARVPEVVRAVILEDPPFDTMGKRIHETPFHSMFCGMQQLLANDRTVSALARELAELRLSTPGQPESVRLGDLRDETSLRFSARCLLDLDPDVLVPIIAGRWLEGYDFDSVLRAIRCPMLLLEADESAGGMLTHHDAQRVASLVADCTRVRIAGVGHLMHWMQTETVLRLITGFLESLPLNQQAPS